MAGHRHSVSGGVFEALIAYIELALYDIESELFGFDVTSGSPTPHQRQYWPNTGKYSQVYLRSY